MQNSNYAYSNYALQSLAAKFVFIIGVIDSLNWPPERDSKADVSSFSPSLERIKELWVPCGLYRNIELRFWLVHGNVKNNRIN